LVLVSSQDHGSEGYGVERAAAEEQTKADTPASTHFAPGFKVDSHTYRAICEQPKDKDQADLCQQWRVAEAADTQALLNALGLLLLAGTLVFTGWAAVAAARAAKAAQSSVELTSRTAERQLRAYVSVQGFKIDLLLDEATKKVISRTIYITWINSGATPARNVRTNAEWALFGDSLPSGFDFPDQGQPMSGHLGPEQIIRTGPKPVPDTELIEVAARRKHLIIWGWLEYDDVFVRTPRHRTEYCVQLRVNGDPMSDRCTYEPVIFYEHNGADEDCKKPIQTNPARK
jgi:hypothetical protein